MAEIAIPAFFALLIWWLGTGIVLFVARMPARTYRISLAVGAMMALAAIAIIAATAETVTAGSAYLAFAAAIVIWGFVELTFLTGMLLGPDRAEASPAAAGWARRSWWARSSRSGPPSSARRACWTP